MLGREDQGKVVGVGTHSELVKSTPLYKDLAKHQLLVDLGLEAHKLRTTLIDSVIEIVEAHIDRVDVSQVGVSDVEWTTGRTRAATGKARVTAPAAETVA